MVNWQMRAELGSPLEPQRACWQVSSSLSWGCWGGLLASDSSTQALGSEPLEDQGRGRVRQNWGGRAQGTEAPCSQVRAVREGPQQESPGESGVTAESSVLRGAGPGPCRACWGSGYEAGHTREAHDAPSTPFLVPS